MVNYKITVEDGKLVLRNGNITARFTLSLIQKKIQESKEELEKWRRYEKILLDSQNSG
jgi:hypothetical protein